MISVEQATSLLHQCVSELKPRIMASETVSLYQARGRILARSIKAPLDYPLFDNSAMDGFALRSSDTQTALESTPCSLNIVGEVRAGDKPPSLVSYRKYLVQNAQDFSIRDLSSSSGLGEANTAIRIMTGAPIPRGADAVVMKEDVIEADGVIRLIKPVKLGANIRRKGEDIQEGEKALDEGMAVTPGVMGFLAALGIRSLMVSRKPTVSVFVTGHELVSNIKDLGEGKIVESNSILLGAALQEMGMAPLTSEILEDNRQSLKEKLKTSFKTSDVVLITGGVSVGDYDYTREVLEELGVREIFWKVSQKPGKPLYVGCTAKNLIVALPGNPYAVFACFYLYVRPALLNLMGAKKCELKSAWLPIDQDMANKNKRVQFLKGQLVSIDGVSVAKPLKGQGSHLLGSLIETDLLIVIPHDVTEIKKGEKVKVYFLPE